MVRINRISKILINPIASPPKKRAIESPMQGVECALKMQILRTYIDTMPNGAQLCATPHP